MAQLNRKMTTIQFSENPDVRHQVQVRAHAVQVDGTKWQVRAVSPGCFVTTIDGQGQRLYAVANGDAIHVQHKGRAWRLEHVDLTRPAAAARSGGAGASLAPMPGVVVSLLTGLGQTVNPGDALLVIESMKLQMTISAAVAGEVVQLPLLVGQTFQRGDVLVRVQSPGESV